ncbi:MAG: cytochrome c oxidase subunit II [Gammaproteobacteria bacterium]|nr:cytochrome c oxidase subunit II [Gammaproteobacteria bacterium]
MKNNFPVFISRICLLLGSWFCISSAYAESRINMPQGVTPMSHDIYALHMMIFWICVSIGVLVFSVLIYSLIKFRKSKGAVPADFHEHTVVEITWAVIPFLILVAMAIPATKVLMRMDNTDDADVTIKIVGYQWKWKYEYLDQGISYFSNLSTPVSQLNNQAPKNEWYLLEVDRPLVVPIHQKIRFLVTANDVIHSWWVPALGIKRDAIPGYIHESWARIEKTGTYRGQCAELCGVNHGFMPIVVEAVTPEAFAAWVQQQTAGKTSLPPDIKKEKSQAELLKQGETLYTTHCAICHKPEGTGMPPAFPALKGSVIATGPVKNHIAMVLNGKPGTAMQAFKEQLSDEDIAAIVTYERHAWGNDDTPRYGKEAGGTVQAAQVASQRAESTHEKLN